jgi:hypothetical protein
VSPSEATAEWWSAPIRPSRSNVQFNGVGGLRTYISFMHWAFLWSFPMSNTSVKVAFLFFVVLALPTASFARAAGQEEATGHLGGGRPNAAAISAADSVLVDPSGIGNGSKVAMIPPSRMRVATIPQFK